VCVLDLENVPLNQLGISKWEGNGWTDHSEDNHHLNYVD
jgi:hypothetical protein